MPDLALDQSTSFPQFDVIVVGAGVVGCAIARRLTLGGARVAVVEKALDALDGASKGNSAILHTGFDAPPGSLEQTLVARGYREYRKISKTMGLPVLKCGGLVLAWNREQLEQLSRLIEKAHSNGVDDVAMLSRRQLLQREPSLSDQVVGGFEVPGESLVDPWTTAHAYLLQAMANGAKLIRGIEIQHGRFDGTLWTLNPEKENMKANYVINCAGLYGDIVDRRLIGRNSFTVTPRKGQFIVFDKSASSLVSSILLPVPTQKTKGVVICRTIFGNLLVGPTAEDQQSREDASTVGDSLIELQRHAITMIPQLADHEITASYAGLRPATEYQDYQIHSYPELNYLTIGGIRSTGLSAALGIADYAADAMAADRNFGPSIDSPVVPQPDRLSDYHPRDWESAGNEGIVCHCELVTRREIERVLQGPMAPATLQGLKRRTRVCMGRCQGFYCSGELAAITEGRLQQPLALKA